MASIVIIRHFPSAQSNQVGVIFNIRVFAKRFLCVRSRRHNGGYGKRHFYDNCQHRRAEQYRSNLVNIQMKLVTETVSGLFVQFQMC